MASDAVESSEAMPLDPGTDDGIDRQVAHSLMLGVHGAERLAPHLRPRAMLPSFLSRRAARTARARGRQLQRLVRQRLGLGTSSRR
jgi:hypothetical protein